MLLIIAGLLLLWMGAEGLVGGSSRLAARAGIPPLVVGLTVVAFGTSAPELVVSLSAAWQGYSEVAVGNVIGSNIFNLAGILGLSAVILPLSVNVSLIRREIPIMIAFAAVTTVLVMQGQFPRWIGALLFLGLLGYLYMAIRWAKSNTSELTAPDMVAPVTASHSVWRDLLFVAGGIGLLVVGARLFVDGAVDLARQFALSEALIGLTIVAAGTSLPELATSVVAALKRQTDIAVGNVVGSNIFNVGCILGLTTLIHPLSTSGFKASDGYVMLLISLLLLPLAWTQKRINRPEGLLLMACYAAYLWLIWPTPAH